MTPEQLRELEVWLAQHTAGKALLDERTIAAVRAAYAGVNFYDPAEVTQAAEQAADASNVAQTLAAGLMAQYLATILSTMTGEDLVTPSILLPPIRFGADMPDVFRRPIKLFRLKVSQGVEPEEAYRQAMQLAGILTETNNSLATREASRQVLTLVGPDVGVTGYRRVLRPELSRTGSCGLCIVASDQVYKRGDLLPLHARCNCSVMVIIGEAGGPGDPGNSFNNLDLATLYAEADSTHAYDLKKLRVRVANHGELGLVLTDRKHAFSTLSDLQSA